jgi:trigger factor
MKTTVKNLTPTRAQLTITLETSEMHDAEQVALHKAAKKLKVAGFRAGKAPIPVVAKHADPQQLALDTVDAAISKSVAEAFMSNDLRALEQPQVEVMQYEPKTTLKFTAEADIMPTIKLTSYKKVSVVKAKKTPIKKAEVDEIVDRIRGQMATTTLVNRAAKNGDEVRIDFTGKKAEVAFEGGSAKDYTLTLGSNSFIPGFEDAIVGHSAGDAFVIRTAFPKDYHVKDLAGQKVTFDVVLHEVSEKTLPEANDEMAAKAGTYSSMEDLTNDIRRELESQQERRADDAFRNEVVAKLAEASEVPVPDVILAGQRESVEQDLLQNLMYQGKQLEDYLQENGFSSKDDWLAKEATPIAESRAKASLVLAEVSRLEKITVSADEVEARVQQFKQQYAKDASMATRFDDPAVRRDIESQLVIDKTIDRLVDLNSKKS